MDNKNFSTRAVINESPSSFNFFSEGANQTNLLSDLIAFDIETFSPSGFPSDARDPIVNFSLVVPLIRKGILSLSVIGEAASESEMLHLLHRLLLKFEGAQLLTYNGAKFDIKYVVQRGEIYGLNFEGIFANFQHIDVYQLVKLSNINLSGYDQKSVERCLGIPRLIRSISGNSYHLFYRRFLRGGSLKPMFYNIEDSFGCLRIAKSLLRFSRGKD
jgi:DNA polymerase elongation subunit (family B)